MEKMLTRQNVVAESSHVETIPINFVATEDGRTLLALTEHKDDMLEIVATPVMLVGQSGTATSLIDVKNLNGNLILHSPVFQISVENIVSESELQQSTQGLEPESSTDVDQQMNLQRSCGELTFDETHTQECQSVSANELLDNSEKDERSSKEKPINLVVKKSNSGRPKKSKAISLISSQNTDSLMCDICHQEFGKQTLYRKHMENHAEEKPHRCPKCSASFNVPTNFTLHMATHNTGEPKCPECGKKFARMASLKSHMLLHEKEENLFCTECEDAFSTKTQLDAHLKLHGEKWTIEEVRKCKLCNKQFSQPALYRLHIREHYRLQTKVVKQTKRGTKHKTMYKCTICLKSFQKPSQLMRHIRVHTGEKPFKCTQCGRAFTQKSSLQIHTWQHNGIRPHACEFCNAKFSQKGNLNAHIMRVHNVPEGEPIYGCNYCSCVFKKLGSLNGHMKRMHTNVNEENAAENNIHTSDNLESDIRATVNNVITQLASLESNGHQISTESSNLESRLCTSESTAKKDILQQALKNSGLPSKNKTSASEGVAEAKKFGARINFVTLLDRAPDGDTRKYLTIKQRCVGNVKWYACTFCHKEFKKPSDLIRHLRVHTQEKPFKCTYCHRSFALKSTMIVHERTHSSVKRYACGSCDKTFVCHSSLIAHTRLHGKSETGFDEIIGMIDNGKDRSDAIVPTIETTDIYSANRSRTQTTKGKSKLSPEAESLVPQVILQEPLVISDTGYKISVASSGKKKRACEADLADQARPHKCWICQAAFRKVSHLKQHHRRHTGERPYKCTTCDRRFTSNSVLKSHLHTHEDSRPYGCSVCNAKFSTQRSVKRHLVTHSNKRPFMCPYCHKTFKTYVNCRKHMKIHKHELAQRQLEEQKMSIQEQASDKLNTRESPKQEAALESSSSSSVSVTTINSTITTNISITTTASINTTSPIVTTSSSTFSDSLALSSRLGSVELSFQPQLATEFSQAFSEFQNITEEKEKIRPVLPTNCDATTFINQNVGAIAVTNLESSPILQADEAGSVTLPVYSGDQTLTPESIREIEETLNQQFFNIGMNFNLGGSNHSRHSNNANTSDFGHMKEQQQQQPVLNVIYESNNNNNNNNNSNSNSDSNGNVETCGEHVFPTQLDSFEMDHITLQSDGEIDIGLDTRNSTSMASILPRNTKDEHRLSVCVATPDNMNVEQSEKSGVQAVVFVSQSNFSKKENATNEFAVEETRGNNIHKECTIDQIFFTEELRRGTAQDLKVRSNVHALPPNVGEIVKTATGKISCEQSLLQCHMCSQQGFTTVGLKEHLTSHRGTKEYQCTECSSKFYTNGGLNRHSKIHVVKQSLKCSSCEKQFNNRVELRSHSKIHETSMWNASGTLNASAESSRVGNGRHSPTNDIAIEPDSTVSEKVLLDTVAEREVMDQVENILAGKKERKEYTNRCKYCPKTFRKPSDLVRHVRTHTGERPYKCDYCNKSFAVKCTLDSHTKVHTGKKTFRCHVCNSLFTTKGSLKVHMRLHTGSRPFRCPICDSRFRTSGHRKVHLVKHAHEHKDNAKRRQKHLKVAVIAEVAANLERCNEKERKMDSFEGKQQLEEAEEEEEQQQQQQQQQLSQTVAGLTSHLETYSIETATSCLTDQINFDAEDNNIVSSNNQTIVSINESNQLVTNLHFLLTNGLVTIQTEESLLSQPSSSSVNNNSHHRPIGVPDAECALSSVVSDTNEQHTKGGIHIEQMLKTPSNNCLLTVSTTVTPPRLEQCRKVTTEETLSVVADDKPTIKGNLSKKECDICGKTFTKPYQVERHKRIHTGERPYKCDLCTKSFAQKSTLQMHQKHHTGDRPYACPYCEYSFTQKGNLRTHVKRVHQLDTVDVKKWKRSRQSFLSKTTMFQENAIEDKSLNLDNISFVELLK